MSPPESFLSDFLAHQLLDIGDDDGRYSNLEAAAESIQAKLESDPWQLARYVRVGLDKDIAPEEPVLDEVEEAIKAQWRLFRNKHTIRPISILRAVLWEAVGRVHGDELLAVIGLTARAEYTFANLGPEAGLCERFLNRAVAKHENMAIEEWENFSRIAIKDDDLDLRRLNEKNLIERLMSAGGPESLDGAIEGGNPHWPSANQPWNSEFGKQAGKAIAGSVNGLVHHSQKNSLEIIETLAKHVNDAMLVASRKTELLWWSQSKFCMATATSFSELPKQALPFFLALDLQRIAPGLSPQSVEHFLAHVINDAAPKTKKLTVGPLIESLIKGDFVDLVRTTVEDVTDAPGRCGLLGALKRILADPTAINQINNYISGGTTEQSLADFAKRFHFEFQLTSVANSIHSGEPDE